MNPFDLNGPDFLLVYLLLGLVGVAAVTLLRWRVGGGGPARSNLTDPYAIAVLRGGAGEAIRVAILALAERKLLTVDDAGVLARSAAPTAVNDVLERVILERTGGKMHAWDLVQDGRVLTGVAPRLSALRADGLIPDYVDLDRHFRIGIAIAGILAVIAAVKIMVALARGHSNVAILIFLALGCCAVCVVIVRLPVHATPRGRATLAELRRLFAPLRNKYRLNGVAETIFLTAMFGAAAVPGTARALYRRMFPRTQQPGSSCGSSCNSSSSSSCSSGSSCGSSSCGGGGGCGGCGSSS